MEPVASRPGRHRLRPILRPVFTLGLDDFGGFLFFATHAHRYTGSTAVAAVGDGAPAVSRAIFDRVAIYRGRIQAIIFSIALRNECAPNHIAKRLGDLPLGFSERRVRQYTGADHRERYYLRDADQKFAHCSLQNLHTSFALQKYAAIKKSARHLKERRATH
jgi:hypothetical protein